MAKGRKVVKRRKARIPRRVNRAGFLTIKKAFYLGDMVQNLQNTVAGSGNCNFYLTQCSELSTHATLYDQYRLCAVAIRVIPMFNDAVVGATNRLPTIYTYWDNTDSIPPVNAIEVINRQKYKLHRGDKPWREYFKGPRSASPVYNGSVISGYEVNKPNQWMSTANPSIPHYGWKWYADNMSGYAAQVWVTLYVQFKQPK